MIYSHQYGALAPDFCKKGTVYLLMDDGGSCTTTSFTTLSMDNDGITGFLSDKRQAMLFLLKNRLVM